MHSVWCKTQDRLLKELLGLNLWGMLGKNLPRTLLEPSKTLHAEAVGAELTINRTGHTVVKSHAEYKVSLCPL